MPLKRRRGGAERRKKARTEARLSMRVEGRPTDSSPAQVVTESQNISSSGVYCRSSHFLAPYSKVDLTIVLPRLPGVRAGNELLKCEGIVIRCDPAAAKRGDKGFQLACMFSGLETRHREMLEEFVTWRNLQSLRAAAAAAQGERPARSRASARGARARKAPARAGSGRATARGPRKAAPRRRTAH
jgi:hypothetical protein